MAPTSSTKVTARPRIPGGVWALGFVSMFMDISSEMIHALLPIYLVSALGASTLAVGVIEGIAEATAAITKVFSGALSDWLGKRKILLLAGYGLAALSKPAFPLAPSLGWLVAARFADRVGKGIRGAPRDALIADIVPPDIRGASFGLRQSLDTIGAFVGPTLAILFMWMLEDRFSLVFWLAVIPAFISVGIVLFIVREPERNDGAGARARGEARLPIHRDELARLPRSYWMVVGVSAVFTLSRFSEAFLLLDAQRLGVPLAMVPAVMIAMNLIYSLSSYPVGVLADRVGRMRLLGIGIALLVLADLFLALGAGYLSLAAGVLLWGLHMGFTQGLFSALVADTAPPGMRGTAFGVFNFVSGLALLLASVIAGALWEFAGPSVTFMAGGLFAALSAFALLPLGREIPGTRPDTSA